MERHATEKEREDVKVALTGAADYLESDDASSANSKVIRLKLTEVCAFDFVCLVLTVAFLSLQVERVVEASGA